MSAVGERKYLNTVMQIKINKICGSSPAERQLTFQEELSSMEMSMFCMFMIRPSVWFCAVVNV
jgi:hypothetical protein